MPPRGFHNNPLIIGKEGNVYIRQPIRRIHRRFRRLGRAPNGYFDEHGNFINPDEQEGIEEQQLEQELVGA